ncbi:MAG: hypothetical protein IPG66_09945 [Hydrogenophilales bacterium]|nr:hypothetical protein [Hydrogenophilales bacterium]
MTLSLYSTYKTLRREKAPNTATPNGKTGQSIQSGVCHALVLLGMGIEGMSCGGDVTPSGKC